MMSCRARLKDFKQRLERPQEKQMRDISILELAPTPSAATSACAALAESVLGRSVCSAHEPSH
jgi:hypothetical protein